ncbi:MAG TPA: hydroxymyristoyl-ACP dehydratase [Ramlibacter sp.]|uniref:hydroxymyristoyl-ACP dehydratase n=1 Tax=Ramlibacter sp. TaxID=1917967 RepID=UPI002D68CC4F|nr:hydroxymyristoyl-ACP dehydratase [Ramlibacter sp.]HZY19970.1 hydroxymyristoyl-ACP dehydratase [Ramlibacter sp.]
MSAAIDRHGIARLVPHAGSMCLLASVLSWDAAGIRCTATSHTDPAHPLRTRSGLLASAGIEYAAQAAAVHGGLRAAAQGSAAVAGRLASARAVALHRLRLDDLPGELVVEAQEIAADARQLLYAFRVAHADQALVTGRLAVVLGMEAP